MATREQRCFELLAVTATLEPNGEFKFCGHVRHEESTGKNFIEVNGPSMIVITLVNAVFLSPPLCWKNNPWGEFTWVHRDGDKEATIAVLRGFEPGAKASFSLMYTTGSFWGYGGDPTIINVEQRRP